MKALNILVAEDNNDHAEMIIDALNEFNSENVIHRVTNGELLIKYLKKICTGELSKSYFPDLIFLDFKMPILDGIGALKVIKNDDLVSKIPIIMLSTSNSEDDINKCYRLGASTYIVKPFDYHDFVNKIHSLNIFWATLSKVPPR